jgi:hypothetical protein
MTKTIVISLLALGALLLVAGFMVPVTQAGTYNVADTGQNQCYSASGTIPCPGAGESFFGQDAQNSGNQPSYTVSTDGLTVYDNVTGLTWTRSADSNGDNAINYADKLTYDQAQGFIESLNAQNYGGYGDWRLPTIKELYSLIDFRGTDPIPESSSDSGLRPYIDSSVFGFAYGDTSAGERIIDAQWLTDSWYVSTVMNGQRAIFGVNFADGRIKGYPSTKLQYVYFVRGNSSYGHNSFADNGNGTITDHATGLMWSQDDSGSGMNWESALAWVQQRNAENHLGHSDWRLPNAKELQSIVDYGRSPDTTGSAAIHEMFNSTQITNLAGQTDYPFYWSGTSHLRFDGTAFAAVYVAFGRGMGAMNGNLMDVHGAGCQRSDPKYGEASDYPRWGNGPQGDVQRVFNFVRLVRNAS